MWVLDHEESWAPKNWCFWTVVLEKTLESPLDSKKIKLVNPKGNQLWIFIGRTDAEAEAPILWPPDATSWLTEKDPDAGKDWRQEEKGEAEDEIAGWNNWLKGHEFGKLQEMVKDREAWHAAVPEVAKSWIRLTWHSSSSSMPGSPVHHCFPEFTQIHAYWVCDSYLTISSSVVPFSSCPQSFPASGSFPMSQHFPK